ncbi:tyrosine-protein phosphatase [Mucilaginibacter agri]|uniref:protein-tyrosine-phosphatase n=1 Tax=Mucilaginibacter agri TaxID=2695265 RepID=A0A965ZEA1_9SPHI|nr:CpsB/CapC family capsule biosynthesis tyrosine phosphatase [Mucilaginibacter agri]NCD68176.1 capsular biosynthesis protein [Mucilaginibacter agri]
MFGIFKRKKEKTDTVNFEFNYDQVMVDMHSHVLPGIDDGAQTVEESIVLIRKMMELGIKKIIATPHVMVDMYRNTPETIAAALKILKDKLAEEQIEIDISAAAENLFDEGFEQRIDEGTVMTMGDNYVLFELSFVSKPPHIIEIIQKMRSKGYQPILAHPERYSYLTMEDYSQIREWGALLQVNTNSVTGYYGVAAKAAAEQLIDAEMVDFISSDMHHPRHAEAFEKALTKPYLAKLIFEQQTLKNKLLL